MNRTARVGVAAVGQLAAMVALSTTLASAAPADPSTPVPPANTSDDSQATNTDWGPNHDGWTVDIYNDSSKPLKFFDNGPVSYIHSHDDTIAAGTKVPGHVKGKESSLHKNEPANIDFGYGVFNGGQIAPNVYLKVRANNWGVMDGTTCSGNGPLKCAITTMDCWKTIVIHITGV